jgi:hypothetical protein
LNVCTAWHLVRLAGFLDGEPGFLAGEPGGEGEEAPLRPGGGEEEPDTSSECFLAGGRLTARTRCTC